jgi:hypothetical protein
VQKGGSMLFLALASFFFRWRTCTAASRTDAIHWQNKPKVKSIAALIRVASTRASGRSIQRPRPTQVRELGATGKPRAASVHATDLSITGCSVQ